MKIVTPIKNLVAELQPINGWKPVYDRDYGGIEWHHPERGVVFATPDWNRKGEVMFAVESNGTQRPVATFRLPTQLNVAHRAAMYQRQAAKVLARI